MRTFDATSFDSYIGAVSFWISDAEIARVEVDRGLLLSVQYGTVWITQAGSIKDVFVQEGGSFLLNIQGRTLVSLGGSEATAALTLTPAVRMAPKLVQRLAAGINRLFGVIPNSTFYDRRVGTEFSLNAVATSSHARSWNIHGERHAA